MMTNGQNWSENGLNRAGFLHLIGSMDFYHNCKYLWLKMWPYFQRLAQYRGTDEFFQSVAVTVSSTLEWGIYIKRHWEILRDMKRYWEILRVLRDYKWNLKLIIF